MSVVWFLLGCWLGANVAVVVMCAVVSGRREPVWRVESLPSGFGLEDAA